MSSREAIRPRMPYFAATFVFAAFSSMPLLARQIFAQQHLDASQFHLGLIPAVGALTFTLLCPLMGHLADKADRRLVLVVSGIGLALSTAVIPCCTQPWQLVVLAGIAGALSAALWPGLELAIGEGLTSSAMVHVLGIFNVCWSSAMCLGMLGSGALYELAPGLPFWVAAALAATGTIVIWRTPRASRRDSGPQVAQAPAEDMEWTPPPRANMFIWVGWIGNLGLSLSIATIRAFFPRLGLAIHLSPTVITLLVPAMQVGQLLMFMYLGTHGGWCYRMRLLLAMQCVTALATLATCVAVHPGLFVAAFFALGAVGGFTYASSLYYSLSGDPAKRGFRAGVHESVIGAGLTLGPFIGGVAAALVSRMPADAPAGRLAGLLGGETRVPFWAATVAVFLTIGVQMATYLRMRRRMNREAPAKAGHTRRPA